VAGSHDQPVEGAEAFLRALACIMCMAVWYRVCVSLRRRCREKVKKMESGAGGAVWSDVAKLAALETAAFAAK
jgi:L-lactate utilization protein LutB